MRRWEQEEVGLQSNFDVYNAPHSGILICYIWSDFGKKFMECTFHSHIVFMKHCNKISPLLYIQDSARLYTTSFSPLVLFLFQGQWKYYLYITAACSPPCFACCCTTPPCFACCTTVFLIRLFRYTTWLHSLWLDQAGIAMQTSVSVCMGFAWWQAQQTPCSGVNPWQTDKAPIIMSYIWQWHAAEHSWQSLVKSLAYNHGQLPFPKAEEMSTEKHPTSAHVHCPLVWTEPQSWWRKSNLIYHNVIWQPHIPPT